MLGGFIGGLVTAWFLNLFGVGNMVIEVLQPFTNTVLTHSHYYIIFAIIGLIGGAFCHN